MKNNKSWISKKEKERKQSFYRRQLPKKKVYLISISSSQVDIFLIIYKLFLFDYWDQRKVSIGKIFIKWHCSFPNGTKCFDCGKFFTFHRYNIQKLKLSTLKSFPQKKR